MFNIIAKPANLTKQEEKIWKETEKEIKKEYNPKDKPEMFYGTVTKVFKAKVKKRLGSDPFKKKKSYFEFRTSKRGFYLDTPDEETIPTFDGGPDFSKIPGDYQDEVRQLWNEHLMPVLSTDGSNRFVKEFLPVAGTGLQEAGHVSSSQPGTVHLALESLEKMHEDSGRRDELMAEVAATIIHEIGHLASGLEGGEGPAEAMEQRHQQVVERVRDQQKQSSHREHRMFIPLSKFHKRAIDLNSVIGELNQAGEGALGAYLNFQKIIHSAVANITQQGQQAVGLGFLAPEQAILGLQGLAADTDRYSALVQEIVTGIQEDPSGSYFQYMRGAPQLKQQLGELTMEMLDVRVPGSTDQQTAPSPSYPSQVDPYGRLSDEEKMMGSMEHEVDFGSGWLAQLKSLITSSGTKQGANGVEKYQYDLTSIDAIGQMASSAQVALDALGSVYQKVQYSIETDDKDKKKKKKKKKKSKEPMHGITENVPLMEAQQVGNMIEKFMDLDNSYQDDKDKLQTLEDQISEKEELIKSDEVPDMVKQEEIPRYEDLKRDREMLLKEIEANESSKESYQRQMRVQLGGPQASENELSKIDDELDTLDRRLQRMESTAQDVQDPTFKRWMSREFPQIKNRMEELHKERASISSIPAKKVQWSKFEGEAGEVWKQLSEERDKLEELEANLGGTIEVTTTERVQRTDPTTGNKLRGFDDVEKTINLPVTDEVIAAASEKTQSLEKRKEELDRIFDFADVLGVGVGKDTDSETYDPLSEILGVEKGEGMSGGVKRLIRRPWVPGKPKSREYKGGNIISVVDRMLEGVGRAVVNPKQLERQLEMDNRRLERLSKYKKTGRVPLFSPETGEVMLEDEMLRDAITKNTRYLRELEGMAETVSPEELGSLQEKIKNLDDRIVQYEKDLSKINGPRPLYVKYEQEREDWELLNPDELTGARNRIKETKEKLEHFSNPVIKHTMERMNQYIQDKLDGIDRDVDFTAGKTYLNSSQQVSELDSQSERSALSNKLIKEQLDRRVDLLSQYKNSLADITKKYKEDYVLYKALMRGEVPEVQNLSPLQAKEKTEDLRFKLTKEMNSLKDKLTGPVIAMRAGVMDTLTNIGRSLVTRRVKIRDSKTREERQQKNWELGESGEGAIVRSLEEYNWDSMRIKYNRDVEELKPLEFLSDRNLDQDSRRKRTKLRNRIEEYEKSVELANYYGVKTTGKGLQDPASGGAKEPYYGLGEVGPSKIEHREETFTDEEKMLRRKKQERIKKNKEERESGRQERKEKGSAERAVGLSRSKMDSSRKIKTQMSRVLSAMRERGFEPEIGRQLETHYKEYLPKDEERNMLERLVRSLEGKIQEATDSGNTEGIDVVKEKLDVAQEKRDELVLEMADLNRRFETDIRMGADSDNQTRFFRDLTAYKMSVDKYKKAVAKSANPEEDEKVSKAEKSLNKYSEKLAATVYSIGRQEEHRAANAIGLVGDMVGYQTPFTGKDINEFNLPKNLLRPEEIKAYFIRMGK